jgi:hypothetical protein
MENIPEARKIEIGQDTLKQLNKTRKWTMFLAVSGFIFLGLIVAIGIITGTFLTAFNQSDKIPGIPDAMLLGAFSALALMIFFPVLFLFRFSKHASKAISTLESKEILKTIKYLKRFFVSLGILLIITTLTYLIALVLDSTSIGFLRGLG